MILPHWRIASGSILQKWLGAPVDAVLAGSSNFIKEARRHKYMFGGAFRQVGIVTAGYLYALEHHVESLADDHEHARILAKELSETGGIEVANPSPESNMVFFRTTGQKIDNPTLLAKLSGKEISIDEGEHISERSHICMLVPRIFLQLLEQYVIFYLAILNFE